MNKHRSKKCAIISLLIVIAMALPILTMLPELTQGMDIQAGSFSLVIEQTEEKGIDVAVNWGSRPLVPVYPVEPQEDAVEVAVNWGSRVPTNSIPLPPPV